MANSLEWYDFVIYGFFAENIGKLFFPASNSIAHLMMSLGVFSVGLLARPIGAFLFGRIGDKKSRKMALIGSLYLMAFPTFLIGLLPAYESVGLIAPFLLIVLRFMQGIAMGGGFTSSMVFLIEHADHDKRGRVGSFASFSLILGIIVGSGITTLLSYFLPLEQLEQWGWRIPFILSIFGSFLGIFMQRNLEEPSHYTNQKVIKNNEASGNFLFFCKKICVVMLLDFLNAIGFFLLVIFLPIFYKIYLKFPFYIAQLIHFLSLVIFGLATIGGGNLSDLYGRKIIIKITSAFLIFSSYLFFKCLEVDSVLTAFLIEGILAVVLGIFFGTLPATLTEIFPTRIRLTGISIGHNLSMAIFGGTAPLLATYCIEKTHHLAFPGILLSVAALLTFSSLHFLIEKVGKPLD
ncbi:MAG: MFS transporter [Silvanigrellaceae bacterium]|nr:MFS transporter [Silvanigrellaceae bacterium]